MAPVGRPLLTAESPDLFPPPTSPALLSPAPPPVRLRLLPLPEPAPPPRQRAAKVSGPMVSQPLPALPARLLLSPTSSPTVVPASPLERPRLTGRKLLAPAPRLRADKVLPPREAPLLVAFAPVATAPAAAALPAAPVESQLLWSLSPPPPPSRRAANVEAPNEAPQLLVAFPLASFVPVKQQLPLPPPLLPPPRTELVARSTVAPTLPAPAARGNQDCGQALAEARRMAR